MGIGRSDGDLFDQRRLCIRADMRLEAIQAGQDVCLIQRASPSPSLAEAMMVASMILPVLTLIDLALNIARVG